MAVKNKKTLPKYLIIFLLIITPYKTSFKCNKRLLNTFLLHGMSFSISKKMKICGNVHDKCCTLADEIKISKMWNNRVLPMLDERSDAYVDFVSKIVFMNHNLLKIDPRKIILKYTHWKKIPYEDEICSVQTRIADEAQKKKFEDYEDGELKKMLGDDAPADLKVFTHEDGVRHWTKRFSGIHAEFKDKYDESSSFDSPNIEFNEVVCKREGNVFMKELVIVNEGKSKFCLDLYEKFLNFDNDQFKKFLPVLKNSMIQVAHYKSSFYCAICDVHSQKFVDFTNGEYMVNHDFCKTILRSKREYIEFLHILLIEYFDSMLQYLSCYESEGNIFSIPFQNFLIKYKRRIPILKRCLNSLDEEGDEFKNKCWFICNRFSFLKVSTFFDGNLKLVKRVYLAIYSFLRKLRIERQENSSLESNLMTDTDIDGMLVEPITPADFISKKYYADDETREQIFGQTDTRVQIPTSETLTNISDTLDILGLGTLDDILDQVNDIEKTKEELEALKKEEKITRKFVSDENKKKINGAMKEEGYSKASGLINKLVELKDKNDIHSGYFTQRKLKQIKKIKRKLSKILKTSENRKYLTLQLKFYLIKKIKKNRSLKKKLKKKKDLPIRIEPSHAMYINILPPLNVNSYKVRLRDPGMNPLIHYNLINYSYTIKQIFSHEFKTVEKLNRNVVLDYLRINHKNINKFNHGVGEHTHSYWSMPFRSEFDEANREIWKARKNGDKKVLRKYLKLKRKLKFKLAHSLKYMEDKKILKKHQLILKNARLEKKFGKVEDLARHHVDKEHFHSNFEGFKDLFVNLFGQ